MVPQLTEEGWTARLSAILGHEFGVRRDIPAVFIDTHYTREGNEAEKFRQNTDKLWRFAVEREPFECKDIQRALTEIGELRADIEARQRDLDSQKERLEGLERYSHWGAYCLSSKCYTQFEVAAVGTGFLVLGLFAAVVLAAVIQNRRVESHSYDVEHIEQCYNVKADKSDFQSDVSLSWNSEANTTESTVIVK